MRLVIRVSTLAALLLGSAAIAPPIAAAAPVISGAYVFSLSSNCQAILSVTKNPQGLVTGVNINDGGALNGMAGTATFTPATGRVAISGTNVDGRLLLKQGVNTQTLQQMALAENWPYSNTATTVTINGIVYRGAYGKLLAGGIVQEFSAVGREEANRCVLYGTFTHK